MLSRAMIVNKGNNSRVVHGDGDIVQNRMKVCCRKMMIVNNGNDGYSRVVHGDSDVV